MGDVLRLNAPRTLILAADGDALDTFTGVAQLLEVDFHYRVDGFGSVEEYVK